MVTVEETLGRHDQSIKLLETGLREFSEQVRAGMREQRETNISEFRLLHKEMADLKKRDPVNLGWIFSGVSLILLIGTMALAPLWSAVSDTKVAVRTAVAERKEQGSTLDASHRREMQLLNASLEDKVDILDRKYQEDLSRVQDTLDSVMNSRFTRQDFYEELKRQTRLR